jgi:hypothetical protein
MALAGGMVTLSGASSGITVIGVAPDGNRTVRLVLGDGSSERIRVANNVYVARDRGGFRTVALKDSRGLLRNYRVPGG